MTVTIKQLRALHDASRQRVQVLTDRLAVVLSERRELQTRCGTLTAANSRQHEALLRREADRVAIPNLQQTIMQASSAISEKTAQLDAFTGEVEDLRRRNEFLGEANGQLHTALRQQNRIIALLQLAIDDPKLLE